MQGRPPSPGCKITATSRPHRNRAASSPDDRLVFSSRSGRLQPRSLLCFRSRRKAQSSLTHSSFSPLLWMLSISYLPRSQEISQKSKILVSSLRDKYNSQDDQTSHVNVLEPFVLIRENKRIAEAYLVSIIIAKRVGLKKYFTKILWLSEAGVG